MTKTEAHLRQQDPENVEAIRSLYVERFGEEGPSCPCCDTPGVTLKLFYVCRRPRMMTCSRCGYQMSVTTGTWLEHRKIKLKVVRLVLQALADGTMSSGALLRLVKRRFGEDAPGRTAMWRLQQQYMAAHESLFGIPRPEPPEPAEVHPLQLGARRPMGPPIKPTTDRRTAALHQTFLGRPRGPFVARLAVWIRDGVAQVIETVLAAVPGDEPAPTLPEPVEEHFVERPTKTHCGFSARWLLRWYRHLARLWQIHRGGLAPPPGWLSGAPTCTMATLRP